MVAHRSLLAALLLAAPASLATLTTQGQQMQGQQMQGQQMQGQQMQGQQMQGQQMQSSGLSNSSGPVAADPPINHRYDGWYLDDGQRTSSGQITYGQLSVVDPRGVRHGGVSLVGAIIPADQSGVTVWTMVRNVQPDPESTDGSTYLYWIDRYNPADGSWSSLCNPDANGVAAAIPVAATFDTSGNRVESATNFTFGCTSGVIAKCYRWGYKPWLSGGSGTPPDQFARLHWACTRLARADYCGNGKSWTQNGTTINVWDRAPYPGPFQDHGSPPPEFVFEAGWSTAGAVCLSKQRWFTLPPKVAADCPDRLVPPGAATAAGTVCNSESEAAQFDSTTQLFDESQINVKQ